MRKELKVDWDTELRLMNELRDKLLSHGLHASNTVIVTVSTDYSSIIGQYLRHQLTNTGMMMKSKTLPFGGKETTIIG